jgi:4'-phosphopantetheinyl transferase
MKIYALKFMEMDFSLFNKLMKYINKERKAKIYRFVNDKDKYIGLISEILMRSIICDKLNICNNHIFFEKNQFGKPFLKGYDNFHFNISHSGEWIVCTVDDKDIGVDIEKIQQINYIELAQSFFAEKECKFIFEASLNDQLNFFYRIWTLKESYIKADGRGLTIPLKSFAIEIINNETIDVITTNSLSKCYFKEFDIDCLYKMSICSLNSNLANEVVIISQNELVTKFMRSGIVKI